MKQVTASAEKSRAAPEKQFDAFHPDMPKIPGVPSVNDARTAKRDENPARARRLTQIAGIVGVVILVGAAITWWITSAQHRTVKPENPEAGSTISDAITTQSVPPIPGSDGSQQVAGLEELAEPWGAKKFIFVKPFTHERVDAMLIRLPGGAFWALALQEPYGHCELEYVTDLARLATQYGYQARHPMIASPCSRTIYDPMKLGSLGGEVWTRGEIVQGSGIRPPMAINVEVKGRFIIADRME